MDPITKQQIAQWAGGTLSKGGSEVVRRVVTNSREVKPGDLFVALRGERFDGHDFIPQVVAQVAEQVPHWQGELVVLAERERGARPEGVSVVEVEDTIAGLQRLANGYRRALPARVVGVTGSSGKTSTKDFTFAVLSSKFKGWCTQGNLNNHIGVPLTLLSGDKDAEFAVVEMGMNHAGEIAPLAAMALPEVGIITNIGVAHIEFLGSREAIAREKGALASAIGAHGTVVLSAEDAFTPMISEMTAAQVLTAGINSGEVQAVDVFPTEGGSRFGIVHDGARAEFELAVPGLHMVRNAALAVAAGLVLGVSLDAAAEGLRGMRLTKGRMENRLVRGVQFLDDTYNANPDSMCAALATLAQWPAAGKRIAVLGRMGELGNFAEEGHREVGRAAVSGIDRLITVGAEADWISAEAVRYGLGDVVHFENPESAVDALRQAWTPGDVVLVKGSRSSRMERIIEEVERL
jgi:UDP-N-acetylmuramoyl-tripeptide--D-alanyl-D-alanine ligase